MDWGLIIQFVVLMVVVCTLLIIVLYRTFVGSVDGVKKRLEEDINAAHDKQAELSEKIKQADEELKKRKAELKEQENDVLGKIEEEAKEEKSKVIDKAREEAEEIITKAQKNSDNIRKSIEKDFELKVVDYANRLVGDVLSSKSNKLLSDQFVSEFIEQLNDVDMSKLGVNITTLEILSVETLSDDVQSKIVTIVNQKLGRDMQVSTKLDPSIIGGIVLEFEGLKLDGSVKKVIYDKALEYKANTEKAHQEV